ncbi:MAG: hypothetical protein QI223_03750 [Candidatus Korarchaeota archaeon]|nr:hypothetical protein [Candidatus Korarchaeota archaeon]
MGGFRSPSPLIMPGERLRLLRELRERGFYVRMHAYEYLVGDNRGFLSIILLEPREGEATILRLRRMAVNQIVEAITSVDPGIRIVVEDLE